MLKEPRAGRVKTRLGKDIGMVPAAWWFRHQSRRLLRELEDPFWAITLAISPYKAAFGKRISAFAPCVFQNVRWSTRHALADTIKTLPDARIALIDTLHDVDTLSDLKKFNRQFNIPKGHDAS